MHVYQVLRRAAGRTDPAGIQAVFEWTRCCEDPRYSLAMLRESGYEFARLDVLLADALTLLFDGDLGRELQAYQEAQMKQHRLASGRELLHLIYKYFATGNKGE